MSDRLRESIQELLNQLGDGWAVTQYVVAMGLERLTPDGRLESTAWFYAPHEQADWQTGGLLSQAKELHYESTMDDD